MPTQDYAWGQGEDLIIEIEYRVNNEPVDLTNYAVRMDVAPQGSYEPIFSFNSDDFDDLLDQTGPEDNEATLGSDGKIQIIVSRSVTLPGGAIGEALATGPTTTFSYDLFLRDKTENRQKKLVNGNIIVTRSITRWS